MAGVSSRERWMIASRSLAAIVGGYALTAESVMWLARLLPEPRVDAVLLASFLSYPLYLVVILWAFIARRTGWVWGSILIPVVLMTLARLMWWS